MKRISVFILFASLALMLCCTQSLKISSLQMPDETVTSVLPIDIAALAEKYKNYDGVFLEVDQTIEHSGTKEGPGMWNIGASWKFSRIYHERYVILNPEAQWLTTFELSYIPKKIFMTTTSPSGKVTHFGKSDFKKIQDKKGDDRYKIAFPLVEKGTIIEIGWESSYEVAGYPPPLEHEIAIQHHIPCEHFKFSYAYPNWWTVSTKRLSNTRDIPIQFIQNADAKKTIMVYEVDGVKALRDEPFAPPFKQVADYLQFMVTHFEMLGVSYDSPSSWEKTTENFRKYAIKKADKRPKEMQMLVDSLCQNISGKLEKFERIADYVSHNIELNWKFNNGDPGKTISTRKGTQYDITALTQVLLNEAGIESDYLLVHDAEDGWFDPSFVSPEQLYTPALQVHIDTAKFYIFPWIKKLPVTLIPEDYQEQTAMLMGENQGATTLTIPQSNRNQDSLIWNVDLTLDTLGIVRVIEQRTMTGLIAYNYRRTNDEMDQSERKKWIEKMVSFSEADLTLDSFKLINDTIYSEPLKISISYSIGNLIAKTPEEIIFQTAGLLTSVSEKGKLDTLERENPVLIMNQREYKTNVTIHYPVNWTLVTPFENANYENRFGHLSLSFDVKPEIIHVERRVSLKRCYEPKETFAELLNLMGQKAQGEVPSIVFKTVSGK